jgi:poly(A) polymerase
MDVGTIAWLPALVELSDHFAARGYELVVYGGAIRDHLLGRSPADLDLLSDARPEESAELLRAWAGNVEDTFEPFGLVECVHDGTLVQVVPYRTLECNTWPRPLSEITGTTVEDHLACLDVTINTIAVRLADLAVIDPFDGLDDVRNRLLRTPIPPRVSLGDNPLLALRIARFVAELSFSVDRELVAALRDTAPGVAYAEAGFRDHLLEKLLSTEHPRAGADFLTETGIAEHLPARWRHQLDEVRASSPKAASSHFPHSPGRADDRRSRFATGSTTTRT